MVSKESISPPRLILVLGSGGVRSIIAAVGIAEVLAAEGLRPDLIVAGLFARHDGPRRHVIVTPNHALGHCTRTPRRSAVGTHQMSWGAGRLPGGPA